MRAFLLIILACLPATAFAWGGGDEDCGSSTIGPGTFGGTVGGSTGGPGNFGGEGGGDYGVGCFSVPQALEADAKKLRESFYKLSFQELLDQQILGVLCKSNECGNLDELQASLLLNRAIEDARSEQDALNTWEARWTNRVGAFVSIAGLFIAGLGLRVAWSADKLSRQAEINSARNSVEIDGLKRRID